MTSVNSVKVFWLAIAVMLHRRREDLDVLPRLELRNKVYRLSFRKKWLTDHPLTLDGLAQEQACYDSLAISLEFE